MTDGMPRRPGRPKKYDPGQLRDHGAPKLSIRFDPALFEFLQEQPGGSRAILEELVRKQASPIRKLALGLALTLKELSAKQLADGDELRQLALRSVDFAARLLSFGKDDPDAVALSGKLAITAMEQMDRRDSLKAKVTWKEQLLSAALNLSSATSEFFLDPANSDDSAKNGLDALAKARKELKATGMVPSA